MILTIPDVLPAESARQLREKLASIPFVDGAVTAGKAGRAVKNNLQADMTTPEYSQLNKSLLPVIAHNDTFRSAFLPQKITKLRFSRYRDNMTYGAHIDSPLMDDIRTDVAFTLFLAEADTYDGGELVIEDAIGERAFKLKPGHMIAYPATTLHRVTPVTRGERLVLFGWAQSAVRDDGQREILYDLGLALRATLDRLGPGREVDLIGRAQSNLLRMWAEL
jgi:PKHD-type hydroxylase